MPALSDAPPGQKRAAIRAGAGIFCGFLVLAAVDALAIEINLPLPAQGVGLRLADHAFDAAETLGVGAVAAAVSAGAALLERRWRWSMPAAYTAVAVPLVLLAIGTDLRRAAAFTPDLRFEGAVFALYLGLVAAAFPVIHLLGTLLSRSSTLALAAIGVAVGAMIGNEYVLGDDYAGIHAVVGGGAAVFAGTVLAPFAGPAAEALGRSRRGRAALAATGAFALFGLLWPPPNAVRCELFRRSAALAPWALASTVWRAPALHAPVSAPASSWFRDRAADPPVPPASLPFAPRDPVVVLLSVDAVRADAVSDPANDELFPTLAAMKRSGVVFTHASAPGAQTPVSLSTVFSGRYFSELYWTRHGAGKTRFYYPADDTSIRFPALLTARGVDTESFGSLIFLGSEFGVARGFRQELVAARGAQHAMARDVIEPLLARLQRPARGPLFLFTHLMEPHAPYTRGRKDGTPRERYLSEIAVADEQIGRVRGALQERFGDRWLLIVTSDHGEAFGEHQTFEHGKTLYEELLHVPLLVAGPRLAPRTIDERVGLVDLGPTILDLFGTPTPATFEGQSLAPLLGGLPAALTRPLIAEGRLRRALTLPDGLKVIEDPRRKLVEVYDLEADPGELRNLFDVAPARADAALAALRAFFAVHTLRREGYETPFKL